MKTIYKFRKSDQKRTVRTLIVATVAFMLTFTSLFIAGCITAEASAPQYSIFGDAYKTKDGAFCLVPAEKWCSGGLCFNESVPLEKGMTASFEYKVTGGESSSLGYADGLVFVISPNFYVGGNGGSLGFPGGINTYGVEFDSYYNYEYNDPENEHIAVINESVGNHIAVVQTPLAVSGSWTKAKVEYKDMTITVYVGGKKILSASAKKLPEEAFVGFTASTGAGYACHEIRNIEITGYGKDGKGLVTSKDKFSVKFNADGGEVSEKSRDYLKGERLGKLPTPKKTGYKFKGWYYTTKTKSVKASKTTKVTSALTLKAKWELKSKKIYKVKLNPNGGTGGVLTLKKHRYVPLVLEVKVPEKKGSYFRGWSEKKNGKIKYRYKEEYKADRATTLYAVWEKIPSKTVTKTSKKGTAKTVAVKKTVTGKEQYKYLKMMLSEGTIKIPGLDSCCVDVNGKRDICDCMVPQGICIGESNYTDYIFVSAYCHDQLHNSVIHVIRCDDKKYIGTVTLGHPKGKNKVGVWDHNGGICCDGSGNLWVANSTMGVVSSVRVDDIVDKAIEGGKKKAPLVKYKNNATFQCFVSDRKTIDSASFMTWYDDMLWVGYCKDKDDKNTHATIYGYSVNYKDNGEPSSIKRERSWPLPMHANGAAFYNGYLFVSSQTGRKNDSQLVCYRAYDNGMACIFEKKGSMTLPPMLEELCSYNGMLYSIYESGASSYQKGLKKGTMMNEICIGSFYDIYRQLSGE